MKPQTWLWAQRLADQMGATCYTMDELKGDVLYETVQKEIIAPRGPNYRDTSPVMATSHSW